MPFEHDFPVFEGDFYHPTLYHYQKIVNTSIVYYMTINSSKSCAITSRLIVQTNENLKTYWNTTDKELQQYVFDMKCKYFP